MPRKKDTGKLLKEKSKVTTTVIQSSAKYMSSLLKSKIIFNYYKKWHVCFNNAILNTFNNKSLQLIFIQE
jgi:hypothetical protein